MTLSVIQQFDILAQLIASGNIATTARTLKLPAADVVAAMDRLEERLGCRLFATAGSSVELTETGSKIVKALGALTLDAQEHWINGLLAGELPGDLDEDEDEEEIEEVGEEPVEDRPYARPSPVEEEAEAPSFRPRFAPAENIEEEGKEEQEQAPRLSPPRPASRDDMKESPAAERPQGKTQPSRPEPLRHIMLASHPAIFSHFQEALVAFEEASPDIGITLHLDSMDAHRVQDLFARKQADIAYFYALEEPEGIASRYAWSERISLFVGKDHPLARKDATLAEDLAAVPYIALAPGTMARDLAEEALARCGLDVGPALLETDNLYEIMKQVQRQPCYFAAFGSTARDFGKMPGITRLNFAQGLPQVQVRQAVRPDLGNDPALLALAEFLFR